MNPEEGQHSPFILYGNHTWIIKCWSNSSKSNEHFTKPTKSKRGFVPVLN
jgi:hypothetical protein